MELFLFSKLSFTFGFLISSSSPKLLIISGIFYALLIPLKRCCNYRDCLLNPSARGQERKVQHRFFVVQKQTPEY
jgi:hypothetical protein